MATSSNNYTGSEPRRLFPADTRTYLDLCMEVSNYIDDVDRLIRQMGCDVHNNFAFRVDRAMDELDLATVRLVDGMDEDAYWAFHNKTCYDLTALEGMLSRYGNRADADLKPIYDELSERTLKLHGRLMDIYRELYPTVYPEFMDTDDESGED